MKHSIYLLFIYLFVCFYLYYMLIDQDMTQARPDFIQEKVPFLDTGALLFLSFTTFYGTQLGDL